MVRKPSRKRFCQAQKNSHCLHGISFSVKILDSFWTKKYAIVFWKRKVKMDNVNYFLVYLTTSTAFHLLYESFHFIMLSRCDKRYPTHLHLKLHYSTSVTVRTYQDSYRILCNTFRVLRKSSTNGLRSLEKPLSVRANVQTRMVISPMIWIVFFHNLIWKWFASKVDNMNGRCFYKLSHFDRNASSAQRSLKISGARIGTDYCEFFHAYHVRFSGFQNFWLRAIMFHAQSFVENVLDCSQQVANICTQFNDVYKRQSSFERTTFLLRPCGPFSAKHYLCRISNLNPDCIWRPVCKVYGLVHLTKQP